MKKKTPLVYCIFRVDKKRYQTINQDLEAREYKGVKAFVPTIELVNKTKLQKNIVQRVPLLFNFGFLRMSSDKAYDRQFLNKLKRDIPGILNFLRSLESIHPVKKRRRIDNAEDFDDFSKVATVTRKEFKYYMELSRKNQVFSSEDIINLQVGTCINLKGYPFNGLLAEIRNIDLANKLVTVDVILGELNNKLTVKVPMENVLYTIYNDYDEDKLLASEAQEIKNL